MAIPAGKSTFHFPINIKILGSFAPPKVSIKYTQKTAEHARFEFTQDVKKPKDMQIFLAFCHISCVRFIDRSVEKTASASQCNINLSYGVT